MCIRDRATDAFAGEVLCTFLLVVTVFSATDGEVGRKFKHTGALLPLSIGFAVLLGKSNIKNSCKRQTTISTSTCAK